MMLSNMTFCHQETGPQGALSNMAAPGHMWLLNARDEINEMEKLNFKFYLLLIKS